MPGSYCAAALCNVDKTATPIDPGCHYASLEARNERYSDDRNIARDLRAWN
jgi:hypothetical protein